MKEKKRVIGYRKEEREQIQTNGLKKRAGKSEK
jgi:hypothetical protein